ncbi:ABC transporter permease [Celeribacter indicus]|uniref:ABC transporter permease n=1 Tax=Celeribacter indicus TaxID=1208324 RepID=A0A0B5E5W7_9RHOB|nr:ABC transporter permease [Celeribacter indicus]AJE48790.1 ABC transporter permease [Celeribacter indicus]SDX59665.1 NitT/TauT family transport system permease protein [Celeribacter indicus]
MNARFASAVPPVLALALFLVMWETACRALQIPSFVLPPPTAILSALAGADWQIMAMHTWATLEIVLVGFGASVLFSIPISLLLAGSPLMKSALMPLLIIIHSLPIVALAPIIIVALGADLTSKAVITCLISYFPMVISATTGLLAAPPEMIELSRSLRGSKFRELWDIRLPSAIPYVFASLRVASTLAVIGAVVGEFVSSERGLGYLVLFSTSLMRLPQSFSALIILILMSLTLYWLVTLVQRIFFPWSITAKT